MTNSPPIIPIESVLRRVLLVRSQKVMIDSDLAEMYGVKTSALNQAVKRNKERFPLQSSWRTSMRHVCLCHNCAIEREERRGKRRERNITGSGSGLGFVRIRKAGWWAFPASQAEGRGFESHIPLQYLSHS